MMFSSICRTCLCADSLNPIFENNDHDVYSNAIYVATGVKIQYDDNLPQNMCTNCINKLNDILKFRKQCKDVETKLLSLITQNIKNTTKFKFKNECNDIDSVDLKEGCGNENIKNETDMEDDKPLKLLFDSQNSVVQVFKLEVATESKYENINNIQESKLEISDIDDFENDIASNENLIQNDVKQTIKSPRKRNYNNILAKNNNDSIIGDSNDTEIDSTEAPYTLIANPVTQKITKVFCNLCNKELSIRSIDSHMTRKHPGADTRKVKCDLCDNYVMKQKLNRHMMMMHGSEGFRCGYCKSEFDGKEELIEHVTSCAAKKRKRNGNESGRVLRECDVCHKVMQKASLRMHKAVKHGGLRPVCEHCGKSFGNKFRLNEHYRAKHGYEKFQCNYCDFRSAGIMAMRNHERRHRGEKPYVCETCGAKFHAAYLLAQHKHSHRTEKTVKCDLCPASFKANNSLHMHKLTCHSSSSYRCGVCSRTYKCRHYAVKHIRDVHRYSGPTPPLIVITGEEVAKETT